ncbi:hypothetical protein M404DRAFT_437119 [Pisolithus tinctorius Marx 270]|uniref:Uncharacterized protein n=1 Tax=Pisolithus tinctorius Marx 270 TaxID=870435 RepID=A0A0C3JBZ7_PISTI|nr:hypothetical protein M404DRAFT_437119 [Pisolithus tinctorius Marx 270]
MAVSNSPQVSSSRGCWPTWNKWVVYTWMCYAFHIILVIIHVVLLALHKFRREQNVVVPSNISNNVASVTVTTTLLVFSTVSFYVYMLSFSRVKRLTLQGYGVLLVWLTQRLALRRDLLQCQTLTATHDKSGAWNGLGAAVNTLRDQCEVSAAPRGVFLVTLYLGGITILHVTSGALLSLVPFDNTHVENVPTQYGMLNLVDLPLNSSSWNTATALIRSISGYPQLDTTGLKGATLYETLSKSSERLGFGNATVAAVTFGAQCYSLSNISATMNPEQNGSYTISMTDGNQLPVSYSPVYGLYENVTNVLYAYGKAITILATPPILDANLDSGSTFNMTETRHSSNGLNDTEIQLLMPQRARSSASTPYLHLPTRRGFLGR